MPPHRRKSHPVASSWLTLIPSTPIKPTAHPQRSPAVLARISALQNDLLEIKETLDVRKYILHLHTHHGRFCPSCTPCCQLPGTCGPTCCLLRPAEKRTLMPLTHEWINVAQATIQVYRAVVGAVNTCGRHVRIAQLREWEGVVDALRDECLSWAEKEVNANGGRFFETRKGVFVEGWGFEGSWVRGRRERRVVEKRSGGVDVEMGGM